MKVTPELIERAFRFANMEDSRVAAQIVAHCKDHGCSDSDTAAIVLRFGVYAGLSMAPNNARSAYALLKEYQGREDKKRIPSERIRKAAEWIRDPAELHELAAFLEGRAAVLEAMPTPQNDVNSDGIEEVE